MNYKIKAILNTLLVITAIGAFIYGVHQEIVKEEEIQKAEERAFKAGFQRGSAKVAQEILIYMQVSCTKHKRITIPFKTPQGGSVVRDFSCREVKQL